MNFYNIQYSPVKKESIQRTNIIIKKIKIYGSRKLIKENSVINKYI